MVLPFSHHRAFLFALVLLLATAFASSVSGYVVYRNVKDFGAKGDGTTDDTSAIITALTQGRGDNPNAPYPTTYSENTIRVAYVYFPPGIYVVSQPLPVIYYTQMVGEASNIPTIKFVSSTPGLRVLEVAGSWYPGANQNNFYRQIRNFVIDMTSATRCTGVHWQVAQATSITNVHFKSGSASTGNQGMWMENGSGGFISDLVFEGGSYGMWVGNQQFTSRNITIRDVSVAAIYLNWDWVWTFQGVYISNSPVGIDVAQGIGSTVIIDSQFDNVPIAVRSIYSTTANTGAGSVLLDNIVYNGQGAIVMNNGVVALKGNGGSTKVKSWGQGSVWSKGQAKFDVQDLSAVTPARPSSLIAGANGNYFSMTRPTYIGQTIVNVNSLGIYGNSTNDITPAIQNAINQYANRAVLFFPHDIYHISKTITIPPGTRIVGQAWSVFMANGAVFSNPQQPTPMFQVGQPGSTGQAHLVDLIFSTYGPQPGAKLIEWNMAASAPGSCGMWDVHFRVGGAAGTNIEPFDCPYGDGTSAPASKCSGAWALMHVTRSASLYMENVWGWVADHDIDQHSQINVYNTRGFLCESQGPVWMYGTAMEHSVLYQYNFVGARNIFMGAIQTETPYYQPSTHTPFTNNLSPHPTDPTFCTNDPRCNMAQALVLANTTDVWLYSAGLYSFFNIWDQTCLKGSSPTCQLDMVQIRNTQRVHMYALSTYGSVFMLSSNEPYSQATMNKDTFCSTSIVDLNLF